MVRMPSALATGGLSTLKVLLLMAVALCMHSTVWAQDCAPPPEDPGCWSDCGECRGDLNEDGLLDQLDLLIFVLFRDQQPQNPCANFNGDCTSNGSPLVDDLDYQILNCLIKERSVLVDPSLPWNPETNPRVYGSCNTNIDPAEPSNCGQTTRSCLVTAVPSDPDRRGCGNPVCCQKVCSVSPFCCDVIWDQGCSNLSLIHISEPTRPY